MYTEQEKDKRYKLVRNKAHCAVNTHVNTAPGGWWHRRCFASTSTIIMKATWSL